MASGIWLRMKIGFGMRTDVKNIEEIAREVTKIKGVKAVYLFGSYVTGKMHAHSDIDMCVFLDEEDEEAELKIMRYGTDNLDVSIFHRLPLAIQYRIFREGKSLIVKDEDFIYRIKKRVLWSYIDFKPHLDKMIEEKLRCTM